jgi:hypothetical protein
MRITMAFLKTLSFMAPQNCVQKIGQNLEEKKSESFFMQRTLSFDLKNYIFDYLSKIECRLRVDLKILFYPFP